MRVLAAVGLLAGCSMPSNSLAIDRVEPNWGAIGQATTVRIEGSGFRVPIKSDVDEGSTAVGAMQYQIGGIALGNAAWRDQQRIEGAVSPGLALGPHDVVVRLGTEEAFLAGGFTVTDGSPPVDAGTVDAGNTACTTFGAWGAPQAIMELNTSGFEAMPRLSADELTIYFHSFRAPSAGNRDIWTATRTSTTAPFGTPTNVSELNTSGADRDPSPSADGLTIAFSRNGDLYIATRATTTQPFSTPQPIANLNTGGTEYFPWLSPDALTLHWSNSADILYATRASTATSFGTPQLRSDINTTSGDFASLLSADGLEIYFTSSQGGSADIWVSRRSNTSMQFGTAMQLTQLNIAGSNMEDLVGWLSPDGQRLYWSSGQVSTTAAIYMATRPCM